MSNFESLNHSQGPKPEAPKTCVLQKAYLGDILLTTPFIKVLLEKGCEVSVLTHPKGRELLSYVFGEKRLSFIVVEKPCPLYKRPFRTMALIQKYRRQFDISVAVHRGFESSVLAKCFSQLWSLGFASAEGGWLMDIRYEREKEGKHEISKNHVLLQGLFGPQVIPYAGWLEKKKLNSESLSRWGVTQRYGIIHPGTTWTTKGWPFSSYGQLMRSLDDSRQWILTGDSREKRRWDRLSYELPKHCINLMGQLSLSEYMDLCSHADIIVGNDSFSTHVASAYDIPCVTVFGSTIPEFGYGPLSSHHEIVQHGSLSCRPCGIHGYQRCPQRHFKCMNEISVLQVCNAIFRVLENIASCHSEPGRSLPSRGRGQAPRAVHFDCAIGVDPRSPPPRGQASRGDDKKAHRDDKEEAWGNTSDGKEGVHS